MDGTERRYFLAIGAMAALLLAALVFLWVREASGGDAVLPDASIPRGPLSGGTGSIETGTPMAKTLPTSTPMQSPEAAELSTPPATRVTTAEPTVAPTPVPSPPPSPATVAATPVPRPAAETPVALEASNLSGRWRIVDTVAEGAGVGQTFSFDVVLTQSGFSFSGGNLELSLAGNVGGSSVTAQFTQPSGITGSFSWSLGPGGNGSGTFQSSVPNSGTSQLIRLP
jgi:hypothetical protein